MTEWDGSGLPPAAQRRMDGIGKSRIRSSLLSIPGATGIETVGFRPASEVMGAAVLNMSWAAMPSCGMTYQSFGYGQSPMFGNARTLNNGVGPASLSGRGYPSYVDVINSGWSQAIARMLGEAGAVHADGVIDIRLSQNQLGSGAVEFVAMGTAVTSMSTRHLNKPFSTHLGGVDVSKLLRSGFAPASLVVEVSVAIRHDDMTTYSQSNVFAPNTEVAGFTDLARSARANARERLQHAVKRAGAQGAIVDDLSMRIFEFEPYDNHRDHVAEVRVVGTSITSFQSASGPPGRSLSILPLTDKARHR